MPTRADWVFVFRQRVDIYFNLFGYQASHYLDLVARYSPMQWRFLSPVFPIVTKDVLKISTLFENKLKNVHVSRRAREVQQSILFELHLDYRILFTVLSTPIVASAFVVTLNVVWNLGVGVVFGKDRLPERPIGLIILIDLILEHLKQKSEDLAWLVANGEFKALVNFIPVLRFVQQAQNWLLA